jgi:hypothetical protein
MASPKRVLLLSRRRHVACSLYGVCVVSFLGSSDVLFFLSEKRSGKHELRTLSVAFRVDIKKVKLAMLKEIMFLGSKVRPVRGADNLSAICEPIA